MILYVGLNGNSLFTIIGLITIAPFVTFILVTYLTTKKNADTTVNLEQFKREAIKITVDLNTAEIKTNSWSEEEVVYRGDVAMWNYIGGDAEKNVRKITKSETIVKWRSNQYKNAFCYPKANDIVYR